MSFFLDDIYIEFCASLTVKVLCTDIEFSQLVKNFADRFKVLSIAKKTCASRKRLVNREKDLCIAKKIRRPRKKLVDRYRVLLIAKKICASRK